MVTNEIKRIAFPSGNPCHRAWLHLAGEGEETYINIIIEPDANGNEIENEYELRATIAQQVRQLLGGW